MTTYTINQLKRKFTELGYVWPKGLHFVAIKNANATPNSFDDHIYLIQDDIIILVGNATTEPGTFYLKNWLNPKGTAVLPCGQYIDTWKLGTHNTYEAFVQAKPVTVFRDNDSDIYAEEIGEKDTGWFGINIHRAAKGWLAKFIDKFSAGCQVWQDSVLFEQVVELAKLSQQKTFTYTLLKQF